MFEVLIEYPMPIAFDGGLVVCIESSITLVIEPDEDLADTDWWIAEVYLEGERLAHGKRDKRDDHRLPDGDPMTDAIRTWAYQNCERVIEEKWREWLLDRPNRRADARRA